MNGHDALTVVDTAFIADDRWTSNQALHRLAASRRNLEILAALKDHHR